MLVEPRELLQNHPIRDGGDAMQKRSCQLGERFLRVAASSNRSFDTAVVSADDGVQQRGTFPNLMVSAFLVYLRDLRHMLPLVLQLGLFATPVAYGMDAIPTKYQLVYSFVNPLAPIIDGYRRTILEGLPPNWELLLAGSITSIALLAVGYVSFKRLETGFADVA
jgi:hypothetical protein